MTTKKQTRQALETKRERMLEELRQTGLEAQKRDRARREYEIRQAWSAAHEKKHHKFVDECPLCSDIQKEQARKHNAECIAKVAEANARA